MFRHLLLLAMLATCNILLAQNRNLDIYNNRSPLDRMPMTHRPIISRYSDAQGYIVYKGDTLKGSILLSKTELFFEHHLYGGKSSYYVIKLRNPELRTIMMYNYDKKPLCMTRINPNDRKMHRLIHEGKLNIYDDWIKFIYDPADIDPFFIIVSYNGEVQELGSFASEGTRHDLIGYINDIYGLSIPKTTRWSSLLRTIDDLD